MQGQGRQWAACWPLLPHELRKPSILLNVVLPPSIRAFSTRVARKEGQSLSARSLLSPTYPWLSFIPQGRIPLHFSIMSSGPSEAPGGQVQCPEMWALIHIWSRVEHSVWMRPLRDPEKVDKNSDWYIRLTYVPIDHEVNSVKIDTPPQKKDWQTQNQFSKYVLGTYHMQVTMLGTLRGKQCARLYSGPPSLEERLWIQTDLDLNFCSAPWCFVSLNKVF